MAKPNSLDERVTALDVTVRELRDRDGVVSHLTLAQDEQVARVLARLPDLRTHLPRLG
jgi:hypothetical protein